MNIMTYAEIKGTVHCDFPQKLIDICFEYGISIVKSEVSTNEYYLENTEYTNIEASVLNNLREICYCIDLLLVDENYKYIHVTDKNTEVACNVFMSDIQRFLSVYKVINLDAVQEAITLNDYNKKGF